MNVNFKEKIFDEVASSYKQCGELSHYIRGTDIPD